MRGGEAEAAEPFAEGDRPGHEDRGEEEELGERVRRERRRRGEERRAPARCKPSRPGAGEATERSTGEAGDAGEGVRGRGTRVKNAATERSGAGTVAVRAPRPRVMRGAPALLAPSGRGRGSLTSGAL